MLGLLAGLIGHERCRHCGRFEFFMIQSAAVVTFNSSGSLRCAELGSASSKTTPHAVGDGTEEQQDDGGYR